MKLRYLIPTFMAVVAAMFVSCSDDNDPTYLDEVRVSSSYVAIPQDGGNVTIDVTAVAEWAINSESIPEWLTVSPASGNAGNATITFSADKADATRSVELLLNCSGKAQRISVVQQAEETDPVIYTVAEAVAMIKNKQQPEAAVYVKGIVCRIQEISVQYGNATYFLSDDGKYSADGVWLQVYRGKWLNGANFTKGDEFGVGDEMLVKGVLIDYQGTPETSQGTCEVISITKSLIGIDGVELLNVEDGEGVTEFPLEGGAIKVKVSSKGNGFHVVIPEAAKKWLHIADFGPDYVTLEADANTGGDRNVTVGFTTEASGTTYSCEQSFSQKGAIIAATVAEFLAAAEDNTQYRLTGVITSLYASDKQGKSFTIADYTGSVLIYRAEGFLEAGAKVGDVVTVVGKRTSYRESPQMGSCIFEELNHSVTEISIADFLTKEDSKEVYYKVTGTLDEIANSTYGNVYLTDGENRLYVYGCYPGWGATGDFRKNCLADKGIEVGDKLTVIGVKATFNGAPQVSNGIYFSHEKPE
ncbi:MAG: DNA-binding protein [Prevotella sp.]|nr:DNA-binding protein [Prevotella sp.]